METVLITGANRGIGLSLAQAHAQARRRVIGVCRRESAELKATGAQVRSRGRRHRRHLARRAGAQAGSHAIQRLWLNAGVLEREKLGAIDAAGSKACATSSRSTRWGRCGSRRRCWTTWRRLEDRDHDQPHGLDGRQRLRRLLRLPRLQGGGERDRQVAGGGPEAARRRGLPAAPRYVARWSAQGDITRKSRREVVGNRALVAKRISEPEGRSDTQRQELPSNKAATRPAFGHGYRCCNCNGLVREKKQHGQEGAVNTRAIRNRPGTQALLRAGGDRRWQSGFVACAREAAPGRARGPCAAGCRTDAVAAPRFGASAGWCQVRPTHGVAVERTQLLPVIIRSATASCGTR
jgi:hypothetical protein